MNAGFSAQPAERVVADDLDGSRLQARDVAVGLFDHFGLEALGFSPAQVHAQQHAGPVLRFGAAGTGPISVQQSALPYSPENMRRNSN